MQTADNKFLARCLQTTEGTASQLSPKSHRATPLQRLAELDAVEEKSTLAHIELSAVAFQYPSPSPAVPTIGNAAELSCIGGLHPAGIPECMPFQFRPVPVLAESQSSPGKLPGMSGEARESTDSSYKLTPARTGTLAAGRIHFYPTRAVILEHQSGAKRIQRDGYIPLHNTATKCGSNRDNVRHIKPVISPYTKLI